MGEGKDEKKAAAPAAEVSLGLQPKEGEIIMGVCHIYASFNDTFVHVTDPSGRETLVKVTGGMKVKADRDEASPYAAMLAAQDVVIKCKDLGIGGLHIKMRATVHAPPPPPPVPRTCNNTEIPPSAVSPQLLPLPTLVHAIRLGLTCSPVLLHLPTALALALPPHHPNPRAPSSPNPLDLRPAPFPRLSPLPYTSQGGNRTKTPGPGAQSALRALARGGIKIGRIEDVTPIPSDSPRRASGRRGRRL